MSFEELLDKFQSLDLDDSILDPKLVKRLKENLKLTTGFRIVIHVAPIGEEREKVPIIYYACSESRPVFVYVRYGKYYYKLDCSTRGYTGALPRAFERGPCHYELTRNAIDDYKLRPGPTRPELEVTAILSQDGNLPQIVKA